MADISVIVGLKLGDPGDIVKAKVLMVGSRSSVASKFDEHLNNTSFDKIAIYEFPNFVRDTFPAPAVIPKEVFIAQEAEEALIVAQAEAKKALQIAEDARVAAEKAADIADQARIDHEAAVAAITDVQSSGR